MAVPKIMQQTDSQKTDLKSLITQMSKQFARALPKHITPDRFLRVSLTAITKNPKLLACTKESVISCLLDCSQIGIEPDGRKAHLIPYGNQCTLIVDYKGLVDLARRSGEIADIHADIICKNDEFIYSYGSDSRLSHKPNLQSRGEVLGGYSFVKLKDNSFSFEVMGVEEINLIRKRSKAANSGPWVTDWKEMAKKTVFRRHSKWLPLSSEYQEAIDKDYDVPSNIIDVPKEVYNPFNEGEDEKTQDNTQNLLENVKKEKTPQQSEPIVSGEPVVVNPSELTEEEIKEYGLDKKERK